LPATRRQQSQLRTEEPRKRTQTRKRTDASPGGACLGYGIKNCVDLKECRLPSLENFQSCPPPLNATRGRPATACALKLAIDLRLFRAKHRKCFFPFDIPSAV